MDLRKYLGSQIKAFRKQAGISQEQLGAAIGMAKNSIWKIETGENWPEYGNLEAIAAKLGIQPEVFFKELPNQAAKPGLAPAALPLADLEKELRNLGHGHALKFLHRWIDEVREFNQILQEHQARNRPSEDEPE